MTLAPIILFVYNRPEHTRRTLEALRQNDLAQASELYIFADGLKEDASLEQQKQVAQVRQIIKEKQWCGSVHIIEREQNKGLADSIMEGVTEIVNRYGRVIVLEDDIVTTRGFLRYMNEALELYQDDEQVMHISGYIYPHKTNIPTDTLFLKVYSCWGWATWKRAWQHFEKDINLHLQHYHTEEDIRCFNINGHMPNYWQLLANQAGEIYTWAVRWYASWLWKGGYALFPRTSLVQNIGFDGTGEHSQQRDTFLIVPTTDTVSVSRIPIEENLQVRKSIDKMFYLHDKQPLYKQLAGGGMRLIIKALRYIKKAYTKVITL